mmetsp:Transcript_51008/g.153332  ORF Transcript_51008/g.153332 Transcript_51008/m.153332 type:complete len:172 (-) Transcript_51008:351-866(-)
MTKSSFPIPASLQDLERSPYDLLPYPPGFDDDDEAARGATMVTRMHCEDRMACALALGSGGEFRRWLGAYARVLSSAGEAGRLRALVDLLLGSPSEEEDAGADASYGDEWGEALDDGNIAVCCCWWLSLAPSTLGLDRVETVKRVIVPEMSRNRALQRLTNEITLEIDALM